MRGIDPASDAAARAKLQGIPTIVSYLTRNATRQVIDDVGYADVVSANNVFSHADDLTGFAECVRDMLKPDGVFVFEVSYLKALVENKVIDYVYHEHLAHHSVKPLVGFFSSLRMHLFDVERVSTKGGSIRCFVARDSSKWEITDRVQSMIVDEDLFGLYKKSTYENLKKEIDIVAEETRRLLDAEKARGSVIAAYGASATATVINELFGLNHLLSAIIDDNHERQGRLSPGYRIPVTSSAYLLNEMPSVTFISAWRFADLIIKRNKAYLDAGGKFIVPLPQFTVVSNYDHA